MREIWKDVPGWNGLYKVSNFGRVKSLARIIIRRNGAPIPVKEIIVRQVPAIRGGYPTVQLHDRGKRKLVTVHSLVAAAFKGPRPRGLDICHKDGNNSNSKPRNLRYGTRLSNVADTARHGTKARGERHGMSKLTEKKVLSIRASRATKESLAEKYKVSKATIGNVLAGRTWRWV